MSSLALSFLRVVKRITSTSRPMVKKTELRERDGVAVLVHGTLVVGPVVSSSLNIARFAAAERALTKLRDPASDLNLSSLCDCGLAMRVDGCPPAAPFIVDSTETTSDINSTDDEEDEDITEVAEILINNTIEDDQEKMAICPGIGIRSVDSSQ